MNVLITGVAGFIGSNLAHALLDHGHVVTGVDNMSQGHPLNLAPLLENPGFRFHAVDVRDLGGMLALASTTPDVIVHLAAYKIPRYTDALETLQINGHGSENVLELARACGAKVVAASTSDVYGKNPSVPFREDSDLLIGCPDVKRWAYAISKMFEEQLLFAYAQRYDMRVVVVRLFGGYGPNQNLTWWGGPQSVFINAALDDQDMEIHGDGLQTRSFTHVSDHVDGFIRCIESAAIDNKVVNIGAVQEIAIVDLARLIWRLVRPETPPRLRFIPYSAFGHYEDVPRRVPDITRARSLLGFEPRVDLESGLADTIRWQIERRRQIAVCP